MVFIISLSAAIKRLDPGERRRVLHDYDAYMDWVDTVSRDGFRQFRHMVRYFLFPDRVERMSSNGERWGVLEGFGVEKGAKLRKWTDRQLDEALLTLRRRMESEHPGQLLDFYEPPLEAVWRPQDDPAPPEIEPPTPIAPTLAGQTEAANRVLPAASPVNLILYGPPGTGKTHWLRGKLVEYTDTGTDVDEETWLQDALGQFGWRCAIAAALADIGRPASPNEIRDHRWLQAKMRHRSVSPATVMSISRSPLVAS